MKVCSKCGAKYNGYEVCMNCGSLQFREVGGNDQNVNSQNSNVNWQVKQTANAASYAPSYERVSAPAYVAVGGGAGAPQVKTVCKISQSEMAQNDADVFPKAQFEANASQAVEAVPVPVSSVNETAGAQLGLANAPQVAYQGAPAENANAKKKKFDFKEKMATSKANYKKKCEDMKREKTPEEQAREEEVLDDPAVEVTLGKIILNAVIWLVTFTIIFVSIAVDSGGLGQLISDLAKDPEEIIILFWISGIYFGWRWSNSLLGIPIGWLSILIKFLFTLVFAGIAFPVVMIKDIVLYVAARKRAERVVDRKHREHQEVLDAVNSDKAS